MAKLGWKRGYLNCPKIILFVFNGMGTIFFRHLAKVGFMCYFCTGKFGHFPSEGFRLRSLAMTPLTPPQLTTNHLRLTTNQMCKFTAPPRNANHDSRSTTPRGAQLVR